MWLEKQDFSIGKEFFTYMVYTVEINCPFILGRDFLQDNKATLGFERKTLNEITTTIKDENEISFTVRSASVWLWNHVQLILCYQISSRDFKKKIKTEEQFTKFTDTVVKPDYKGYMPVTLLNNTKYIKIQRGEIIVQDDSFNQINMTSVEDPKKNSSL